jgi:hypothetical protein
MRGLVNRVLALYKARFLEQANGAVSASWQAVVRNALIGEAPSATRRS